jgi:hypothetical protein
MVKNIEVKESILDKKSAFNVKRFRIGKLNVDRPIKTVDAGKLTRTLFDKEKRKFQNVIFEYSKIVKLETVNNILSETEDKKIKNIFGFEEWMEPYPHVFLHTLTFNPYKEFESIDRMLGYFDHYYEFSDPILFIPNIQIKKYDKNTGKKVQIIGIEEYIKFVHDAYQILDYRSKKPIFVPLSLKFGIDDIRRLASEYIRNEFFCVWIDFEGSAVTKPKIARIRSFIREFDSAKRIEDLIIFSTNIKREILSNPRIKETPASDILASLIGSNIIGVNREPLRPIGKILSEKERSELKKHKARVFDGPTYYYLKVVETSNYDVDTRNRLMNPRYNILFNSRLIDEELASQTEYFLKTGDIEGYVTQKRMIKEYRGGELIRALFPSKEERITDWF